MPRKKGKHHKLHLIKAKLLLFKHIQVLQEFYFLYMKSSCKYITFKWEKEKQQGLKINVSLLGQVIDVIENNLV